MEILPAADESEAGCGPRKKQDVPTFGPGSCFC